MTSWQPLETDPIAAGFANGQPAMFAGGYALHMLKLGTGDYTDKDLFVLGEPAKSFLELAESEVYFAPKDDEQFSSYRHGMYNILYYKEKHHNNLRHILETFDLSVCQIGVSIYDGEQIQTSNFRLSYVTRTVHFKNISDTRLDKYRTRFPEYRFIPRGKRHI